MKLVSNNIIKPNSGLKNQTQKMLSVISTFFSESFELWMLLTSKTYVICSHVIWDFTTDNFQIAIIQLIDWLVW